MERLPLARVPVPVESSGLDIHVEVVGDGVNDVVECGAILFPS